jgi:hypothetical protein
MHLNFLFEHLFFFTQGDGGGSPPADGGDEGGDPVGETPTTGDSSRTFTQAEVNALITTRLEKERAKAAKDAQAAKEEAERVAAEQQGEYQALYEKEKAAREKIEADLKETTLTALRVAAATAAGLPVSWASRLQGETVEALEADAAAMAKDLPVPPAPDINAHGGDGATPTTARNKLGGLTEQEFAARYGLSLEAVKAYVNR